MAAGLSIPKINLSHSAPILLRWLEWLTPEQLTGTVLTDGGVSAGIFWKWRKYCVMPGRGDEPFLNQVLMVFSI